MKIMLHNSVDYKGRIGVKLVRPKKELGLETKITNITKNNNKKIKSKRNFNSYFIFEIIRGRF